MPPKKDPKAEEAPKEPEPEPQPYELTGYGKFQYINGVTYEGNWQLIKAKKMKHGYGKMVIPSSRQLREESYEGNWSQDKMQGFGTYNYPDGSIYEGEWKCDKHHGKGILSFANGTRYEGQWEDHCMQGPGEYTDHLGRKWKGEYRQGKFESRSQNSLVKDLIIQSRKKELQKEVKVTVEELIALFKNQKQQKFKLSPYFGNSAICAHLVTITTIIPEDKTSEEWINILEELKTGSAKVLCSKQQAKILEPGKIWACQLQGPGQIVELSGQNWTSAWLCTERERWVLACVKKV